MRRVVALVALLLSVSSLANAQTGRVLALNSTTTPLANAGVFTGQFEDITQAAALVVTVKADVNSAANGIRIDWSSDCVNTDYTVATQTFNDPTNGQSFAYPAAARCARVVYTNGGVSQSTFRLQTIVRDSMYASAAAAASGVDLQKIGGTAQSGANVIDVANTAFKVNCVVGCSATGSFTDSTAFTFGGTAVGNMSAVVDDVATNTVAENSAGAVRMNTNRILYTDLSKTAANTTAIKVDGTGGTFPMSGTITANQGSPPWSVVGNVASASADSGNPVKVGGIFNTTQPTVTTGQRVDFQSTSRGAQIVGTGADTFNVTVNAALPTGGNTIGAVTQASGPWTSNVTQYGSANVVSAGVAGLFAVGGAAASGASKSGNPLQVGGVFNTTQPTVTTGQAVEYQATARGAQIVATGVDTFNATINTALPTGGNTIGAVTQASGPWTSNVTQYGGTNVVSAGVAGLFAMGGAAASGASKSGNPVQIGGVFNTTQPTVTTGQAVEVQATARGAQIVAVGVDGFNVGQTGSPWGVNHTQENSVAVASPDANGYVISPVAASATATLAASKCNILSAASTNATNCKASAGNVYAIEVYNTTTTVYYLRLYNLTTAPTCSSATGFDRTIPIPPAVAAGGVGGIVDNYSAPSNFGTGIGYCITGGSSSTDNTNAAVGIFGEIRYK